MYCDRCTVILSVYRLLEWPESKGIFVSVCALFYQKKEAFCSYENKLYQQVLFVLYISVRDNLCSRHRH